MSSVTVRLPVLTFDNPVGILPISNGGTNSNNNLSNQRVILSSNGKYIESDALSDGQLLIGVSASLPVVASISGTANQVLVANGPGSIVLSLNVGMGANSLVQLDGNGYLPTLNASQLTNLPIPTVFNGVLPVANGGTGIASGTSGGVVYFNSIGSIESSGVFTQYALLIGAGTGAPPSVVSSLGSPTTVLHGNTSGPPSYSALIESDQLLSDNSTNNVSTSKHGYTPKLPNDATQYLNGIGAYSIPPGVTVNNSKFDHYADIGNTATSETDLYSDTLSAGLLANNGDKLSLNYGGTFVGLPTATKQIKLYFGGTAIFDTGALTVTLSSSWTFHTIIIRVSATVVRYICTFMSQGITLGMLTSVGELTGLTLSNALVLKITGQAGLIGAGSNNIVAKVGTIQFVSHA